MMRKNKLFEIPIYALSRDVLERRANAFKQKMRQNSNLSDNEFMLLMEMYPQQRWDYNHIVGYFVISIQDRDICLDQFVLSEELTKYQWKSNKKHFLRNNMINGFHLRVSSKESNAEIGNKIVQLVEGAKNSLIHKKGYFVDDAAFRNVVEKIDYQAFMK